MLLKDAIKDFVIYLHACRTPQSRVKQAQSVLQNILSFYGPQTPLDLFDQSLVLEYVKENDPFDCDPIHEERGDLFCVFVDWMMHNQLIPAWKNEGRLFSTVV